MSKLKLLLTNKNLWFLFVAIGLSSWLFWNEFKKVSSETVNSWSKWTKADCAVVLTGGPGRVREGFDLLERRQVRKLIISGVYQGVALRELNPFWPFYANLNEEDVILERRSETTFGNAQQSLPIVEALKCRDILLVTSRWHMYRAIRTFRHAFPESIQIYRHTLSSARSESSTMDQILEVLKSLFYSFWAY